MKRVFVALIVAMMTLSVGMSSVEAKRFGGGASFGKQSYGASRQARNPAPQQTVTNKPAAPGAAAATPSPWRGILGGALLGLGLGALFSSLGLSGAMASMISTLLTVALLAFAAMFIYRLLQRKAGNGAPRPAYSGASETATPRIGSMLKGEQIMPQGTSFGGAGTGDIMGSASYGIPADFDVTGFVRNAKVYFIRLQAAWDKADINDIREFTTPEMFAEMRLQLQERGTAENHTDVVSLDAEMLGVETLGDDYLASVKFFGFIKEESDASPAQFNEIWNLSKPVSGNGGWILAGIQQLS